MYIRVEFCAGDNFDVAASQVIAFSKKIGESVVYNWNGADIYLDQNDTIDDASEQWNDYLVLEKLRESLKQSEV